MIHSNGMVVDHIVRLDLKIRRGAYNKYDERPELISGLGGCVALGAGVYNESWRGGRRESMKAMLTILILAFAQNVSFSIVSRSRNRSNFTYHTIAAVLSNGVWFLTFRQLVLGEMNWLLFGPYTIGTVIGSLTGAKLSMWIERKLGATSDGHLEHVKKVVIQ